MRKKFSFFRLLNERKGQYVPIGDESETCEHETVPTFPQHFVIGVVA